MAGSFGGAFLGGERWHWKTLFVFLCKQQLWPCLEVYNILLIFCSIAFFFGRVTIKIIKIFNKDKGVRRVYYSLSAKHSFLSPDVWYSVAFKAPDSRNCTWLVRENSTVLQDPHSPRLKRNKSQGNKGDSGHGKTSFGFWTCVSLMGKREPW